ncbi:hypothetical protein [Brevibacillus sp. SYSU BS000544]|uniref:hypothetical protein n=1 Tax=Brevibacillus sp. SYSU BS000544 TaxID=3416443 RepID=UPI003CE5A491
MKKTIQTVILFLFTLSSLFFALPTSSYACSCVQQGPVKEALASADAVFAGRVTEVVKPKPNGQGLISSTDPVQVTFDVSTSWKGVTTKQITIKTALDSASCGFAFEAGKEYLVYSYKGDANVLETNICTRTQALTAASDDLTSLGAGVTPVQDGQQPTAEKQMFISPYLWATGILVLAGVTYVIVKMKKKS